MKPDTSPPPDPSSPVMPATVPSRARAEEALRESEQRLKHAQQIANVGSWEWDIQTGALWWSDQVYRQMGEEPGRFTPTHDAFQQRIHPEDRAAFEAAVQRALSGSAPYDGEFRIVRPDGTVRVLHSRGEVQPGPDGRPRTMLGVCLDITERKQAEEALRATVQRFYSVLASMYGSILLVSDEGKGEFANQSFCDLFNLECSPKELVGLTADDIIGRVKRGYSQPEEAARRIREIVTLRQPVRGEEVAMTNGGTCLRDFIPIDLEGKSYGRLWHHINITERKRAEEALRDNVRLLNDIIDGCSPSAIFLKDRDGRFITINAPLEKMLGKSREELKGKTDYDLFPKQVADLYRAHDTKVMATGEALQVEEAADLPDGHHFFLANKFPLLDANGRLYGVGAISHDITERKRVEAALRESEQKLALALRSAGMGIWRLDLREHTRDFDDQVCRCLGIDPSHFGGTAEEFYAAVHPDDRKGLKDALDRTIATGAPYEVEYCAVWSDGSHHYIAARGQLARDAAGQPHRIDGLVWDITERKQAEAALRESEARARVAEAIRAERQRLAEVLNLLPAYVVLLSPDYRVPFANRFFEERFGKSEGRRCYEYLFNRTEPCENCQTYNVLKTNGPQRWEWTGPDGRNYDIYDFPFTDVDGSPLIMEVGLDITERKKAEAELTKHREHLQELVRERTAELRATNEELARFNQAMVGRELRMIELKQEINALCAQLGQPPRYTTELDDEARPKQ